MDPVTKAGLEALELAMRWAEARRILRRLLDSKKASEPKKKKARLDYRKLSDQLEASTGRMTKLMKAAGQLGSVVQGVKKGQQVPWLKLMGLVGMGAKAVDEALNGPENDGYVEAEVVDID